MKINHRDQLQIKIISKNQIKKKKLRDQDVKNLRRKKKKKKKKKKGTISLVLFRFMLI